MLKWQNPWCDPYALDNQPTTCLSQWFVQSHRVLSCHWIFTNRAGSPRLSALSEALVGRRRATTPIFSLSQKGDKNKEEDLQRSLDHLIWWRKPGSSEPTVIFCWCRGCGSCEPDDIYRTWKPPKFQSMKGTSQHVTSLVPMKLAHAN